MVTDSLIKKKFVSETLKKGILKIYTTQEYVARTHFKVRTGRLRTLLSKHSFDTTTSSDNFCVFVPLYPYLRFLDIPYRLRNDRIAKHKRRNFALYNRVVWGVLYHETFPQLRFGFTDEVRKTIHNQLQRSFNL